MNILSLFDGMSCGQQALERAGIEVDKYFASEIDKFAIKVTMANYPDTIQLGSVVNVKGADLPKIDMLIGGSSFQSFSFAGKRKGMAAKCKQEILTLEQYLELKEQGFEFQGQSYLFWEYVRVLNETKPKYFLLENVMMEEKWKKIISKTLGVHPVEINSSLLSAQNRKRLYWTNIGMQPRGFFGDLESIIKQPKDKLILLKDILEYEVDENYFLSEKMINGFKPKDENDKGNALRPNASLCATDNMVIVHSLQPRSGDTENSQAAEYIKTDRKGNLKNNQTKASTLSVGGNGNGNHSYMDLLYLRQSIEVAKQQIRRLTPIECERLQTVKDNYTNYVSNSQRYKMLGNGWTVDVIAYIFGYIE